MKENKGQSQWQKQGQQGDNKHQGSDKKGCGCPTSGGGNNNHRGGSNADERGKWNKPNNENEPKRGDRNHENE